MSAGVCRRVEFMLAVMPSTMTPIAKATMCIGASTGALLMGPSALRLAILISGLSLQWRSHTLEFAKVFIITISVFAGVCFFLISQYMAQQHIAAALVYSIVGMILTRVLF